jgi:hypothetical protein
MRLESMRQMFVEVVGERPGGWDDLWAGFVAVIREPIEEPDILRDGVSVEIVPADPRFGEPPRAVLSRNVGIRGGMTDNNLEASFAVAAIWSPGVDVGPEIITMTGRGPSSYEHDPLQSVGELVAQVEQHPVVVALRGADADFQRWVADYQPPEERD